MDIYHEKIVKIALVTGISFLALLIIINSITFVEAGYVGVITRFGAVQRVANPGLVLRLPFVERVAKMETRTKKEQVEASAASRDLQEVKSTIALNYRLNGIKAVEMYQSVGTNYTTIIIAPAMQEAFKATTSKFTAEDLISRREEVKLLAFNELRTRLAKYNIIVDDFNIINSDFSKDFNEAIEQKQVAQQNLERAKTEAQTALTQAEGQANAQKALQQSGALSKEYLEFLALQKWNGVLPLATNGNPFINIIK